MHKGNRYGLEKSLLSALFDNSALRRGLGASRSAAWSLPARRSGTDAVGKPRRSRSLAWRRSWKHAASGAISCGSVESDGRCVEIISHRKPVVQHHLRVFYLRSSEDGRVHFDKRFENVNWPYAFDVALVPLGRPSPASIRTNAGSQKTCPSSSDPGQMPPCNIALSDGQAYNDGEYRAAIPSSDHRHPPADRPRRNDAHTSILLICTFV